VTWAIKDKIYSQHRACALVGLQPKTHRYASKRSDDAPIRHRLLELAQQRRRFGYRAGADGAATGAEPALVVGLRV
jgi:putative transposase